MNSTVRMKLAVIFSMLTLCIAACDGGAESGSGDDNAGDTTAEDSMARDGSSSDDSMDDTDSPGDTTDETSQDMMARDGQGAEETMDETSEDDAAQDTDEEPDSGMADSSDDASEQVVPTAEEVDCSSVEAATTVTITDFSFNPMSAGASNGDVIKWVNEDSVPHTVTSGSPNSGANGEWFDSGSLSSGDEYCLRFDAGDSNEFPWTIPYFCTFHPEQMSGAEIKIAE